MEDSVSSFALRHKLDEADVRKYAQSMISGNSGGANYALGKMKNKVMAESQVTSLSAFSKLFKPIREELYDKFGNVDQLTEEVVRQTMEERNVVEAARKRAEEATEAERMRLQEFHDMDRKVLDYEYLKAIETSDVPRMRDLVNEAARRNGYVSADEFRMAHHAPSYDEEGIDKNFIDIAGNKDLIRESLNEQLRLSGDRCRDESIAAINRTLLAIDKGGEPTVTIYRAIPKPLKEGKVRNGDWISLSESYAKQHGEYALNGEYRIIKEDVPAGDLYWDGNDINEWGYDDRSEYRYKDIKNNRKLNDLITYDDRGNIIPLSRRFNPHREDVRFRFISKKGASNLDMAEEGSIRLDNLSIAREMEAAGNERMELSCYASTLAEKQNIPVSIINSYKDIPLDRIRQLINRKADIRGWYDISSERICLYLPNAAGKADIQKTLLHEGVAHYGLRKLVGNGNMDGFLDNVYTAASGKVRRNIRDISLAQKMNLREATEEYLAKLAEKNITPGFREKIKLFLTEILRALGFNIDIGDSELNYILARSKGNLQCPDTKKLSRFSEVKKNTSLITNKSFATGMTGTPMKITDYIKGLIQLNQVKANPSLIANFENPTEKMQLAAIKADPKLIMNIENPTEKVQLAAVKTDPELIMNIENPSEKVQLLAVNKDPSLFLQIRHPAEKTSLMAVNRDPELIQYIREPSEKVQLAAVRQSENVIRYVENPCEKAQLTAVMTAPGLIGGIENPTERVQLAAVRTRPDVIRDIESPTERVQLLACNADSSLMQTVKVPSEKVCMSLISRDRNNIRYITTPSEKVQFMAVRDKPANILKIDNPSQKVCLSCLATVLPAEGTDRFRENISEPVKSLFVKLDKIEAQYEHLMWEASNMNTYDDRFEAKEKAEAYRTRETSAAVQAFKKEAVLDASAAPIQSATVEKKATTTVQASSKELRFKGGQRKLTVKDGKATLTVNGRDFDATNILTDMKAQGVDISKVPAKAMSEMLKGNKATLPGTSQKSHFSIVKGTAGYGLKAFQVAQQVNGMAAQEM